MSREATPEKRKRSRSMPSMLSRISDVMSSKSRANLDKAIEIFRRNKDQLDSEQRAQQSKLRWHDWMLAFAELCMSFSWGTFMARLVTSDYESGCIGDMGGVWPPDVGGASHRESRCRYSVNFQEFSLKYC